MQKWCWLIILSSLIIDGPRRGRLTGQGEDLFLGPAVVQGWRDDALDPQAFGHQLVHPQTGGQAVVAGTDPVIGGRGDDEAHPARTAGPAANDLPAHERHGVMI